MVVSEANFLDFDNGVPCLPRPLYQAVPHLFPLLQGAIDVGMAEGALDDLLELVNTGRQQFRATVPMRVIMDLDGTISTEVAVLPQGKKQSPILFSAAVC
jgi:hypothetical protein